MISHSNDTRVEDRDLRQLHTRVPRRVLEQLRRRAADEGEDPAVIVRRALKRELAIETR